MLIRVETFKGEIPKVSNALLPKGAAQQATECNFDSGALRAMHKDSVAHTFGTATTDFIAYNGSWIAFTAPTRFAPGPVATDRLYITTEGQVPKLREVSSGVTHDLALPTPTAPPQIAINTEPVDDPENPLPVETVVYVTTWVTDLDEETPPSPVSSSLNVKEGATVDVTIVDNLAPPGTRINRIRVYRSQTSALGTTGLYFVKELSVGTGLFTHDLDTDPLQELIPSTDYDPPIDDLQGITSMQQGMMAAFSGKSLYFCEPYQPHAWPLKYELKTDYDIVGLAATGGTLFVLTKGTPYIVQGTAPENMIMDRMDQNLPCLSKDGIVDVGTAVLYPSHDGLVYLSGGSATIVTRPIFDRRKWLALQPTTFVAGNHDGQYVVSYIPSGEVTRSLLMIDLEGDTPSVSRRDIASSKFSYDIITGHLYYSDGTTQIRQFADVDEGKESLTWKSGDILMPSDVSFSCVLLQGEEHEPVSAPARVSIYGDNTLIATIEDINEIRRLPNNLASKWHIEISGAVDIDRVSIAGAPDELLQ